MLLARLRQLRRCRALGETKFPNSFHMWNYLWGRCFLPARATATKERCMHTVSPTTPPRLATGLPRLRLNFGNSLKSLALHFFFLGLDFSLPRESAGMIGASISTGGGVEACMGFLIWIFHYWYLWFCDWVKVQAYGEKRAMAFRIPSTPSERRCGSDSGCSELGFVRHDDFDGILPFHKFCPTC